MGLAAVVLGALWRTRGSRCGGNRAHALRGGFGGLAERAIITRLNFRHSSSRSAPLGSSAAWRRLNALASRTIGLLAGFLFLVRVSRRARADAAFILAAAAAGCWWWLQRTRTDGASTPSAYSAEGQRATRDPPCARANTHLRAWGWRRASRGRLRRAPGAGEVGRGHGLRADGDHGGGARRGVHLRRARDGFGDAGGSSARHLQNGLRLSAQPAERAGYDGRAARRDDSA